jgi:hypothetical protein
MVATWNSLNGFPLSFINSLTLNPCVDSNTIYIYIIHYKENVDVWDAQNNLLNIEHKKQFLFWFVPKRRNVFEWYQNMKSDFDDDTFLWFQSPEVSKYWDIYGLGTMKWNLRVFIEENSTCSNARYFWRFGTLWRTWTVRKVGGSFVYVAFQNSPP